MSVSPCSRTLNTSRRVLLLGLDGVRVDALSQQITPNILSLKNNDKYGKGAYSFNCRVNDICWSGPGWSSFATGVWRNKHKVDANEFLQANFRSFPNFFKRIKDANPSLVTASVVNWTPINDSIFTHIDHLHSFADDDSKVTDKVCELLSAEEKLDVVFVHLDDVDHAGHEFDYGPSIPQYVSALSKTDERVGKILQTLRSRPYNEDWLVILTTDHGGENFTHELGTELNRRTFVLLHGHSVHACEIFPHPLIVDIAPTVLVHLGISISPNWNLDGRPLPIHYDMVSWLDLKAVLAAAIEDTTVVCNDGVVDVKVKQKETTEQIIDNMLNSI